MTDDARVPVTALNRNRGRIVAPFLVLALAGCGEQADQMRRERMVHACIQRDLPPERCAEAARIAIPTLEDVARCQRKAPPWLTTECKSAMTVHHKES